MEKMNEKEWVRKILSGDQVAVRRLYAEAKKRLYKQFVLHVEHEEDVDELIQDTFLHFLDALPLFAWQSNLWTFMSSIGKHELADYWRKKYAKRIIKTVPVLKELAVEQQNSETVSRKMHEALLAAYAKLKPLQKELLILKYEEEKSVKEIADMMGWSVKAVEAQLYRARIAFREVYIPYE